MEKDLITVLWVENDPVVLRAYPLEAETYGIDLVPYGCWDDARAALLRDFDSFDAIILDAKCKPHKDSIDSTNRFLSEVFPDLEGIFLQKERYINWYVLSGELGEDGDAPIPEKRKLWDGDWPKDHYSKNTDREELYRRLRDQVHRSNANQIKSSLYPEVFRAIENCKLNKQASEAMVDLLEPIHFKGISDKDYNNRISSARLLLEHLFRSMIDNGIIPRSYRTEFRAKDSINLTWCSLLLAGQPHPKSMTYCYSAVFPKIIAENVKSIIYAVGSKLHTSCTRKASEMNFYDYLRSVGYTTNLIKSFSLQLCDLLLWYEAYLRDNPDPKENAKNWVITDDDIQ